MTNQGETVTAKCSGLFNSDYELTGRHAAGCDGEGTYKDRVTDQGYLSHECYCAAPDAVRRIFVHTQGRCRVVVAVAGRINEFMLMSTRGGVFDGDKWFKFEGALPPEIPRADMVGGEATELLDARCPVRNLPFTPVYVNIGLDTYICELYKEFANRFTLLARGVMHKRALKRVKEDRER